jgi:hypothetical protein
MGPKNNKKESESPLSIPTKDEDVLRENKQSNVSISVPTEIPINGVAASLLYIELETMNLQTYPPTAGETNSPNASNKVVLNFDCVDIEGRPVKAKIWGKQAEVLEEILR